ncbi:hypothetical protein LBMAG42_18490 [Deltaproteobacteria bacterium]|nr:hypothetical protein LBMAG42_18490 [Deltaproteobacteria bacterium]
MIWFLLGCATAPDPCVAMCEAAADLYGGCLSTWGADWEAAAYADEDDFLDACATWSWEQRQLEVEAGQEGATDAVCEERAALFAAEEATCDDYTTIDWNTPTWDVDSRGSP